jgi:hypothetical protein
MVFLGATGGLSLQFIDFFLDKLLLPLKKYEHYFIVRSGGQLGGSRLLGGKEIIMKILAVIVVAALVFPACARFQRSETINTDISGAYASGTYSDRSSGHTGKVTLGGSGAGWGIAGGGGFGAGWVCGETGPPRSGSYEFARAVAMINYSKKLKSIKYDEFGGVIDYEFDQQPVTYLKTTPQATGKTLKSRSSFGHQPVE